MLVGTGLLWGTIGVAGRGVMDRTALDPLEISWLRTLFAAPASLAIATRLLGPALFRVRGRDVAAMGALAITNYGFQFLYLIGVRELGVSVATLICLCSIPVLVALASVLFFGDRLSTAVWLALAAAVLGTALLSMGQGGAGGDGAVALGIGASFLSAVGAAVYTIGSRSIVQRYHPITALAVGFPIVLLVFVPVMTGGHVTGDIPLSAWLLLAYLGIGTQSIAYLLFQWGLQTESATVASIVTLLEPVLAAVLAWVLFDERLGVAGIAGAGILIAGLLLLSVSPSATSHPVPESNDAAEV